MASGAGGPFNLNFNLDMTKTATLTPQSQPSTSVSNGEPGVVTLTLTLKPDSSTPISTSLGEPATVILTMKPQLSSSTSTISGDLDLGTVALKPEPSDLTSGDGKPVTLKPKQPTSTSGSNDPDDHGAVTISVKPKPSCPAKSDAPERVILKPKRRTTAIDTADCFTAAVTPKSSTSADCSNGGAGTGTPGSGNLAASSSTSSANFSNTTKMVYQFKISLPSGKPPIWRRIQVSEDFTFWKLHQTIKCLFGWSGQHGHQFKMGNGNRPKILNRTVLEELDSPTRNAYLDMYMRWEPCCPRGDFLIKDYFKMDGERKGVYQYDLRSTCYHSIVLLEKILRVKLGIEYPICIAGRSETIPESSETLGLTHNLLKTET